MPQTSTPQNDGDSAAILFVISAVATHFQAFQRVEWETILTTWLQDMACHPASEGPEHDGMPKPGQDQA